MNKRVFLLGVLVCCALSTKLSAQSLDADYKTAVGVKFGWWESASLSVKHFIKDNTAIEGLLYFWQYGGEGCGLYEYHGAISTVTGLKWYVGGGGHFGVYNTDWAKHVPNSHSGTYLGPDAILGVDYKLTGAPIALSFDVQPRFDVPGGYISVWGGLGVRFAF
jgi:hypothetical protein